MYMNLEIKKDSKKWCCYESNYTTY